MIPTVHSGIHPTQRGQVEEWPINRIDCGEAGSLGSTRETWSRIQNACRGGRFVSYKSSCKSTHYISLCTYRRCCNIHNRYEIKSMREKAEHAEPHCSIDGSISFLLDEDRTTTKHQDQSSRQRPYERSNQPEQQRHKSDPIIFELMQQLTYYPF